MELEKLCSHFDILSKREQIEGLRKVLQELLPQSVQVYNCLVLEFQEEDSVKRSIYVNSGFSVDNVSTLIVDASEEPRLKYLMFSNPAGNEEHLKQQLQHALKDSDQPLFGVSITTKILQESFFFVSVNKCYTSI